MLPFLLEKAGRGLERTSSVLDQSESLADERIQVCGDPVVWSLVGVVLESESRLMKGVRVDDARLKESLECRG